MLVEPRPGRRGFTFVEAVVATAITAMAGAAILLGLTSSLRTTNAAVERTIALGMAQQLMDEVAGARYAAAGSGGRQRALGPSRWERRGSGRERYNDIDDYHALRTRPPEDPWGVPLGTESGQGHLRHPHFRAPHGFFDRWRQEVRVDYVRPPDWKRLAPGQTSDYRRIEVRIVYVEKDGGRRELAKLQRVVAYVPPIR